jgi:hypothetical protein
LPAYHERCRLPAPRARKLTGEVARLRHCRVREYHAALTSPDRPCVHVTQQNLLLQADGGRRHHAR